MKARLIVAALMPLLLLAGLAAQEIPLEVKGDGVRVVQVDKVITVKEDRTVIASFPVRVKAPPGAGLYFWTVPAGVQTRDMGDALEILAAPKGPLHVGLKSISAELDKDGRFKGFVTRFGHLTVDVGDPGPGPKPDPPKPDPEPTPLPPAPIPLPGLRALIIYESAETTASLNDVISGNKVRDYMRAKGAPNGFLALDKDVPLDKLDAWVADAAKRARKELPWLIISNGKSGYEGPVPKDGGLYSPAKTLELLKRFGD